MKDLTITIPSELTKDVEHGKLANAINNYMDFVENEVEKAGLEIFPLADFNRAKPKRMSYNHYRYYLNNGLIFDVEYDTEQSKAINKWEDSGDSDMHSITTIVPIKLNYVVYRSELHATRFMQTHDTTYIFSFGAIENKKQLKSILHLFDRLEVPMCDTRI